MTESRRSAKGLGGDAHATSTVANLSVELVLAQQNREQRRALPQTARPSVKRALDEAWSAKDATQAVFQRVEVLEPDRTVGSSLDSVREIRPPSTSDKTGSGSLASRRRCPAPALKPLPPTPRPPSVPRKTMACGLHPRRTGRSVAYPGQGIRERTGTPVTGRTVPKDRSEPQDQAASRAGMIRYLGGVQ